jgi:hypothetical protein
LEDNLEVVDQDALPRLVSLVDTFYSATREFERQAKRNRDYYDGKQLDAEEIAELKKRKQPKMVENLIRRAVNSIVGVAREQAVDPRAYPRNGSDEDTAASDVATKSLRFVSDCSRFDTLLRPKAFRNMLIEGVVGFEIEWDSSKEEIKPVQLEPDQIIYDPHAREADFSDARFIGHSRWGWVSDIEELYPQSKGLITTESTTVGDRGSDRLSFEWFDKSNLGKRVAVVTLYLREGGVWYRAVFTKSLILEYGVSPYLGDQKQPVCPIELVSIYRDAENSIYGYVSDLIDLQDQVNKRSSKLLHLLNSRQLQEVSEGSFVGEANDARREASRPDGIIPSGLQVVPTSDLSSGQAQLLSQAKADFERASPNPAILGRQGADSSGRAMQIRQQAGLTELWAEFSALEDLTIRVYRAFWARITQFWTSPRFVRVTDDLKSAQMVRVNEPVIEDVVIGQDYNGNPITAPQQVGVKNDLAKMDMDIIIDVSPNTATLAHEQYALLVELAKSGLPIPPEAIIRASSLPEKAAILEAMNKPPETPNPMQELGLEKAKADVRKVNADASKSEASAVEIAQGVQMNNLMNQAPLVPPTMMGAEVG